MGNFYGLNVRPDEIYHYKYVRKYRKNGKWRYVYPGDSSFDIQTDSGEQTNMQEEVDKYVKSHRSKKVKDIDRATRRQTEDYRKLAEKVLIDISKGN